MPESMTGFGRAQLKVQQATLVGEMRSANGRFLKVTLKLPEGLENQAFEIEKMIANRLRRGTVYYRLELRPSAGASLYKLDRNVLRDCYVQLRRVQKILGIAGEPNLGQLLSLPGVWRDSAGALLDQEGFREKVKRVTETALDGLVRMRRREGRHLGGQLQTSLRTIKRLLSKVRRGNPRGLKLYLERLRGRAERLVSQAGWELAQGELVKELALSAERSDLSEELDRLESHLNQCRDVLGADGPVGRKLEFLVQEMLREANTMSSKCVDLNLIQDVLELKSEIDRMREQVLNLE